MVKGLTNVLNFRTLPDGAEPEIISTIKKTFNFSQAEAVHLFQIVMECMKSKELVSNANDYLYHVFAESFSLLKC